jgi:hypothetical protein
MEDNSGTNAVQEVDDTPADNESRTTIQRHQAK